MDLNDKTIKKIFLIILFSVLLFFILTNIEYVLRVLYKVFSVLSPFFIGLCIAFVINILLTNAERIWDKVFRKQNKKGLKYKRPVCLFLSTLVLLIGVFAVCFIVIPKLSDTASSFAERLPEYIITIETWWSRVGELLGNHFIELPDFTLNKDVISHFESFFAENGHTLVNKTANITASIFSVIINSVIAFAFSLYVLAQKENLTRIIKKLMTAFLSDKVLCYTLQLSRLISVTFTKFITGQMAEALIIGALCFIGMLIINIPYAAAISVLVGFTALIPVFGAFIGTAIGAFIVLLEEPIKALWFVIFIIILQQLEGNIIYPKVVGKSVGLPGVWVLIAVTVGGGLFGLAGMFLSVPIFAVIYTLVREGVNRKIQQKLPQCNKGSSD